jgi:hypothetical protein
VQNETAAPAFPEYGLGMAIPQRPERYESKAHRLLDGLVIWPLPHVAAELLERS